jgi:copper transport protein
MAVAVAVTLLVSLFWVAPASAHAELEASDPAAGAVLTAPPERIQLTFDDPIELDGSTIWVYDDQGRRVDSGAVSAVSGEPAVVGVAVRPGLAEGTYTVAWTVSSDDTHPVSGTFRFSVLVASTVTEAVPSSQRNDVAGLLLGVMRWVGFVGLVLGPGVLLVLMLIWPDGLRDARVRRMSFVGLGLLVLSTAGGMVLQGIWASGASFTALWLDPASLDTHSRKFDTVYAVRAYLVVALVVVLAFALRRDGARTVRPSRAIIGAAGVSTIALVATWPLVSHAAVDAVPVLATLANLLHSLAMSLWLGGLAVIVACLTADEHATVRAPALRAFSKVALVAVVTLVVTGVFMTWREVGSVSGLVSTEFGRVLLAKLSAVIVLLLLGNVSRRWVSRHAVSTTAPEPPAPPGRRSRTVVTLEAVAAVEPVAELRRNVVLELVVAAIVLGATAALVVIGPGL